MKQAPIIWVQWGGGHELDPYTPFGSRQRRGGGPHPGRPHGTPLALLQVLGEVRSKDREPLTPARPAKQSIRGPHGQTDLCDETYVPYLK